MSRHFEEIADRCVEAVLSGGMSVDDCLAQHPEHRADLEPLLRAVLALEALPVPEIAPNPERRAEFMAALRATPQDAPRRGFRWPAFGRPSFTGLGALGAMPMRFAAAAAVVVVFVLGVLLVGGGTSTASAATLTVFAGTVEGQEGDRWSALQDGSGLRQGDAIRTGTDGYALITFGDGSTASLEPGTQITLAQLVLDEVRQIEIDQLSGRLWNDVVTGAEATYQIRTPHALVQAHGTVFETVVGDDTSVSTAEGLVSVLTPDESVEVARGQAVRASLDDLSEPESIPLIGAVAIEAPMAAAVSSSQGASTGVLPTGVVVQQIPGMFSNGIDDGPQHLFVGSHVEPGVYSLWLRRFEGGAGTIEIDTATDSVSIPVAAEVTRARIRLAIDVVDGAVFMRTLSTELETDVQEEEPEARVIESERTRAAVDPRSAFERAREEAIAEATRQAEQERDDADRRGDDRDGDSGNGNGGGNDDNGEQDARRGENWWWRDDDRGNRGAGSNGWWWPGQSGATPTPEPTATAAPRGDNRDGDRDRRSDDRQDDRRNDDSREGDRRGNSGGGSSGDDAGSDFRTRFGIAVRLAQTGNGLALQALLNGLLDGDRRADEERLGVLVEFLERSDTGPTLAFVLSSGEASRFLDALPSALDEVSGSLRDRVRDALAAFGVSVSEIANATPDADRDDRRNGGGRNDDRRDDDRRGDDDRRRDDGREDDRDERSGLWRWWGN